MSNSATKSSETSIKTISAIVRTASNAHENISGLNS